MGSHHTGWDEGQRMGSREPSRGLSVLFTSFIIGEYSEKLFNPQHGKLYLLSGRSHEEKSQSMPASRLVGGPRSY